MKKVLAAAVVVSSFVIGCSSMVNPIEIEQPGYELSPVQLQPGFERCSTKDLDEATQAQVELDIATKARDLPLGDIAALNNSFGFGGANVAVAFGSVS